VGRDVLAHRDGGDERVRHSHDRAIPGPTSKQDAGQDNEIETIVAMKKSALVYTTTKNNPPGKLCERNIELSAT
jgi:hypothetical protein